MFAEDLAVQRRSLEDVFLELTGQGPRAVSTADSLDVLRARAGRRAPRQMLRAQTAWSCGCCCATASRSR